MTVPLKLLYFKFVGVIVLFLSFNHFILGNIHIYSVLVCDLHNEVYLLNQNSLNSSLPSNSK